MKRFLALTIGFLMLSSTAWSASDVYIESFTSSGQGCPSGSVSLQLSPDGNAITVLYDRFQLQALGSSLPNLEMNCRIDAVIRKPKMMGFSVESVDFRGFVQLDAGVKASQKVKVLAGGSKRLRKLSGDFGYERWQGPLAQSYMLTAISPFEAPEVLNCIPFSKKTKMSIQSKIKITNAGGGRTGLLAVDTADGRLAQKYNIKWHNCIGAVGGAIGDLIKIFR